MFYEIIMTPGQSIRDIARLCRVDSRFRAACSREYVWRKLYFLKVIKTPGLAKMPEPAASRYINRELMHTPDGVQWTAQQRFAKTPYILLMAFVFRDALAPMSTKKQTWVSSDEKTTFYLSLIGPTIMAVESVDSKLFVHFNLNQASMYASFMKMAVVDRYDQFISFFCRLLNEGWKYKSGEPPMYLQSCLSCGSPTAPFQCGAECGQARYCDQKCANAHWEEHRKECSSKH
jgi:hypothetical protein